MEIIFSIVLSPIHMTTPALFYFTKHFDSELLYGKNNMLRICYQDPYPHL